MTPVAWMAIAAPVSAVCAGWVLVDLRRQAMPRVLVFVVLAVFFRFLLSAFHPVTFPPVVGPFSINALYSLLVIAVGFLVIDRRLLRLQFLMPVYFLILLTLVSAVYNHSVKDSIQSLLKWLFFIVIALAVYESVLKVGRGIVLEKLCLSFSIPLVLQLLSVVLGHTKDTENDGSVSYVGGYSHEAVFSVMMISGLLIAALRQFSYPLPRSRRWGWLPLLFAVCVALTNYRTNILSMLLPFGGYLFFRFVYRGLPVIKVVSLMAMVSVLVLLPLVDLEGVVGRFAEIGTVLDSSAELVKSPLYYTEWEQDYFSARVYIWSQYIDAYLQGNTVQHLLGLGADTWSQYFEKYAHNTFVSYLYELGVFGCLGIAYFFLRSLIRCLASDMTVYAVLLALSLVGFLIMNLGTMPLWQIEGMILFAVLNALVWELGLRNRANATVADASLNNGVAQA